MAAPIVLVPGFWLGAWAWDEVGNALRADGHDVTALTLPGLESAEADRSAIGLRPRGRDLRGGGAAAAPVVLAVHSGAGGAGYAASDRVPERIAALVYVDSGPATGALDPDVTASRSPAHGGGARGGGEPGRALRGAAREFRRRAVPSPAASCATRLT